MNMIMPRKNTLMVILMLLLLPLAGCATSQSQLLATDRSQLALRSIQTRAFETGDKQSTMRSVISTLQDLDFVIDKADLTLGTVTATKLNFYQLRITVTVRPRGEKSMLVRANLENNERAVTEAIHYQNFFVALEKSMFLTAQKVD